MSRADTMKKAAPPVGIWDPERSMGITPIEVPIPLGMAQNTLKEVQQCMLELITPKRYSMATMMDEKGRILSQVKLRNDPGTLLNYRGALPDGTKIALEAPRELVLLL